MFYDKKIKYLNYIVDGERIKGCGFVKVELRDLVLNLEVAVSGLPTSTHCVTDVWLCAANDNYSLGKIYLENGRGSFRLSGCNFMEICPTGIIYEDWKGISIFPQAGWEISGLWGESCSCVLERVEVSRELTGEMVVAPERDIWQETAGTSESGVSQETIGMVPNVTPIQDIVSQEGNAVRVAVGKAGQEKKVMQENQMRAESERRQENREQHEAQRPQDHHAQQARLAEDKWEQLSGIYPHIRPFRDKREYLSIRPADFVLLSAESYKAANNSFLLHGYYNYQHLILARTVKKGEAAYYVGTPGNFFEREKQVAIMFGFTGFECTKDPAREGDFGYYLMEVQL